MTKKGTTMTEQSIVSSQSPFSSIEAFGNAQRMADMLAASNFVPALFRGQLPNCVIALGIAQRLNADVLAVMNSMYDVHGKIGFSSKFLIATVNSSGRFDPIRWNFRGKEGTDSWAAQAYAKEKSTGETLEGPWVSIKMAQQEGWAKDGKNRKTNEVILSKWTTMPEMMLRYRSASFWISLYASEFAMGMRTSEDIADEIQAEPAQVIDREPARKKLPPKNLKEVLKQAEEVPQPPAFTGPETQPNAHQLVMEKVEAMWPREHEKQLREKIKGMFPGFNDLEQLDSRQASELLDNLNNPGQKS